MFLFFSCCFLRVLNLCFGDAFCVFVVGFFFFCLLIVWECFFGLGGFFCWLCCLLFGCVVCCFISHGICFFGL